MDGHPRPVHQSDHHGQHHHSVDIRQPAGDRVGDAAPQVAYHNKLLRDFVGVRRHASGNVCDDFQCKCTNIWTMAVRLFHVRRVEFTGCVLFNSFHTASVLH